MSNTISVKDINKLRKIKKNMYIRIKKNYESKYKDIDIDTCKKIYKSIQQAIDFIFRKKISTRN